MAPTFSVVIPAYNQAEFLPDALESIFQQTDQDFEILVVNDASPDNTAEVVAKYHDPRVKCLTHTQNLGLPAARNTGMAAARGEFIALLDADDFYHPRKLEAHRSFFAAHPEISVTYNARFNMHHGSKRIRELYRPLATAGLKDFIAGFPFSPSDMVIRRADSENIHHFDANMRCGGEDLDFPCRLALAGFRFARVSGALNYRRFHASRKKKKLRCRFGDYTRALDLVFQDPRCPGDVLALGRQAYTGHYTEVACWALSQGETDLANEMLEEILLISKAREGGVDAFRKKLTGTLFNYSTRDETLNHEKLLPELFAPLPPALRVSTEQTDELIRRGYLMKGAQYALWGDGDRAGQHFERAKALGAKPDNTFYMAIASQIDACNTELGEDTAAENANRLLHHLRLNFAPGARQLEGQLRANSAFASFRSADYRKTLREASRAVTCHPAYLADRGILSITVRSLWNGLKRGQIFKNS